MSPIIELQRRMVEAGRIRAGEKGPKGEPRKLVNWRLTSKDEVRLRAASKLWGGETCPWEGHEGEFELYTETPSLPIMLLPGAVPTTWYELWSRGGCQRRCDGVHEVISDSVCLCGEERECKPYTRLSVLLPDLPGIGSWLLTSTGWNAAAELAGAADLLQRASAQGLLIPARLRLEQRSAVKEGQTRRYAVPVLDIDASFRELLGAQGGTTTPALPSGFVPIPPRTGNRTTLSEALAATDAQILTKEPRVRLPDDGDLFGSTPTSAPEEGGASLSPPASAAVDADPSDASPLSPPDDEEPLTLSRAKKKMDAIVGQLRDADKLSTMHLWSSMAQTRNVDPTALIEDLGGYDEDGILHWSPLRDDLTLKEARELHGKLASYWLNVQKAMAQEAGE